MVRRWILLGVDEAGCFCCVFAEEYNCVMRVLAGRDTSGGAWFLLVCG